MINQHSAVFFTAVALAITGCSSSDDDSSVEEPVSYQITVTNLTTGQLMTPPVAAIHDSSVHLFQVGEQSSDAIRDIAEKGENAALVAFAADPANAALVSASGVIGTAPFGVGESVTSTLTTSQSGHLFSLVNMVICTNDGISGVDSTALPADNNPLTITAMAYDAGTRVNQSDNNSFFPGPCRSTDVVEAEVEDPRLAIAAHPGQTGITVPDTAPANSNWDFAAGSDVMSIEIVRN